MALKDFIKHRPIASYFVLAYSISWLGAFGVAVPKLLQGDALQTMDGLLMFPAMLAGPALAGVILTGLTSGKSGLRALLARMGRWQVGARWYAVVLVPPLLISAVLLALSGLVSPALAPRFFPLGILFGLVAGLLEEIGWTGYALPRLLSKRSVLAAGVSLGVLWGLWHLPVIDFLGAASPHGEYWLPYVLAFIVVMAAIRVLMSWVYSHTSSVLLAQLIHASSTGFLVVLSPASVSPAQETLWYAVYGAALWVGIAAVSVLARRRTRIPMQDSATQSI